MRNVTIVFLCCLFAIGLNARNITADKQGGRGGADIRGMRAARDTQPPTILKNHLSGNIEISAGVQRLVPAEYATIQAAINASTDGDTVLVSDGTYLENIRYFGKAITVASLYLIDGDTTHIDQTIIDGSNPSNPDSASVVSFVDGEDTTSVICGFTITGGSGTLQEGKKYGGGIVLFRAGGSILDNVIKQNVINFNTNSCFGAGISCSSTKTDIKIVVISNNRITGNKLLSNYKYGGYGGGIDSYEIDVLIINNEISNNLVSGSTSCYGPGMRLVSTTKESIVKNNLISSNSYSKGSSNGGGILLTDTKDLRIIENRFEGNNGTWGAAILDWNCENNIISNNLFINNSASSLGGGIYLDTKTPNITNNTFTGNSAGSSGGCIYSANTNMKIENSIFWNNSAPNGSEIYKASGSISLTYSDIQGGWAGEGNINADPLFSGADYQLGFGSPCIDAGNPDSAYNDADGSPNDMGAYGGPNSPPTAIGDEKPDFNIPQNFTLFQNYPNPFNPTTTINYELRIANYVELNIYNLLGQKVAALVSEKQSPGAYSVKWNASEYSGGVYFYRLSTEKGELQTRKLVLMK